MTKLDRQLNLLAQLNKRRAERVAAAVAATAGDPVALEEMLAAQGEVYSALLAVVPDDSTMAG